ncbi:MAG: M23 family metallopeptidase [Nitrospirae bacterium]|nr:M23 family metallopeptidase [Nitrospirota bacterium]
MIKSNINRLVILLVIALLIPDFVYAVKVIVTPKEVIPGDVFLLKVEAGSAEAEFLGNKINLYPVKDNQLLAMVPVDIDITPGKYNIEIAVGKDRYKTEIIVRRHKFKTIKLTLPEEKVTLSPEDEERAAREAELLNKIWPESTDPAWNGRFTTPINTAVSTGFGVKRIMNEKKTSVHKGTDFRGETGAHVKAINSGTVVLTEDLFFGGNTLIVDHGMGLYSVYMHLSKFSVSKGDKVSKSQVIGSVGSTGRASGPHLHMSVRLNGLSINPESLFKLEL